MNSLPSRPRGLDEKELLRILVRVSEARPSAAPPPGTPFSDARPTSILRLQGIVSEVLSAVPKKRPSFSGRLAEKRIRYFNSYDRIVGFSPAYLDLIKHAEASLPRRGAVLDIGAGSGNFSLALALGSSARSLKAVDCSIVGLQIAREKLSKLPLQSANQNGLYPLDLRKSSSQRLPRAKAALIHSVLHRLNPAEKVSLLGEVARVLPVGGILFLSDPSQVLSLGDGSFADFIWKVVSGSFENSSPASELDYALFVAAKMDLMTEPKAEFVDRIGLRTLAKEAGFEVIEESDAYYGYASSFVLRKTR